MKTTPVQYQSGAVAILTALLLPLLLGFMALALDVGFVLLNKNQMQVAADAAALVAAGAIQHGQDVNAAVSLARSASQANGFTNGVDHAVVSVTIPPGGTEVFANDSHFVRVTVSQPVNAFLAWIFGITHTDTAATAVSGPAGSSLPCMLTLASAAPGALTIQGNGVVTATTCGMYVNSTSSSAMQLSGNVTVTSSTIQVAGDYTASGNVHTSPITTGAAITADPFIGLLMPVFSGCTYTNFSRSGNGNVTLNPGTYCGGISLTGNYTVVFSPGVYHLYGGGLNFAGNISPVSGVGVSFYNSGNTTTYPFSPFNLSGNIAVNMSAPTTGTYAGMLLMQNPLNTQTANINGNSSSVMAGNLYFPKNNLNLTGNSGTDIPIGSVVALKVSVQGNTRFNMTNTYGGAGNATTHVGLYQ